MHKNKEKHLPLSLETVFWETGVELFVSTDLLGRAVSLGLRGWYKLSGIDTVSLLL